MNYYEHHLGDWAAATSHLTWDEDMAYTRLLRAYYHAERAIPDGQQYRLAKATTPAQRKAVDAVLGEFFALVDGHYHQKRADTEIARYQDKQAKAKRSAEARWNGQRPQSVRNANASPDAMRTHCDGNAHQTPDTREEQKLPSSLRSDSSSPKADDPSPPPPDDRPADLTSRQAERLAQVTDEAITAFNASPLVKANGGMLASVSTTVGREKRQAQVRRCLRTARAICAERYGGPTVVPEFWADVFAEYARDDFHAGRQRGGKGHENWLPDFEFLTREDVLLRLYDRAASEDAA